MQVSYKTEKLGVKAVYYSGADTLQEGYALCYDRDNITALNAAGTELTAAYRSYARYGHVVKPASGNLHNLAGFVAAGEGGKVGPCNVKIMQPTGHVLDVHTDQSCTALTTHLCVQAASYALGGLGSGPVVGLCYQTKDRSVTAGVVQAFVRPLDPLVQAFSTAVPTSSLNKFSPALWESCPWVEAEANPALAHLYFEDFKTGFVPITGTSTTEISQWIQTEVTSGLTQLLANQAGGALRVSSEAFASADDGLTVMFRHTDWVPATGKRLWFEARVKMADIDTTPDQFFIGLTDTHSDIHPSGVIDDTVDKIGFFTHSGSTAATLEFITAKTTVEEITTGAATGLVDATWVNIGFIADLASVTPYVNGVAGTAHATTTELPTAGTGLGLCLGAHVDQTSTIATLDVDWVRIAQLR